MYKLFFASAFIGLLQVAIGGQIPTYHGVIGGLNHDNETSNFKPKQLNALPATPGKLRVTENSGVCGEIQINRAGMRRLMTI